MENRRIITAIKVVQKIDSAQPDRFAKRRTAAYVRVSTSSEEQLNSLEAQKDYFPKFIAGHPNWEYVGLYCDEGLSGTSSKSRPEFKRMIADALDEKIDLIVTKSISRFARNTVDTLMIVRQLKEVGCEVWFEKENLYSCDSKGEFILTLLSSMAQEESRSLSENVKWGVRKRFADGRYSLPYANFLGFRRGEDGKPGIVEEEAKVVRLIYRLFLEGDSHSGIAVALTQRGIPTPAGKIRWEACVIRSILSNEKYYGAALLQKRYIEDYLTKKARRNKGELPQYYVDKDHDPIVIKAVYAEVQRRRESETWFNPLLHDFSNKIICSECGNKYGSKLVGAYKEARPGHRRYIVWYCNRRYTIVHERRTPSIPDDIINNLFGKAIQLLWDGRSSLRSMLKKSIQAVLPPEKRSARLHKINMFIKQFGTLDSQSLSKDRPSVQVMLDRCVITPEKTACFHFINGERITFTIPSNRKPPDEQQK